MDVLRKLLIPAGTAVALLASAASAGAAGSPGVTLTPVPTGNVVPTSLVADGAGSVWFSGSSPTLDGPPLGTLARLGRDGAVVDELSLDRVTDTYVTAQRDGTAWVIRRDRRGDAYSRIVRFRDGAAGNDVRIELGDRFAHDSFATDAGGRLWIADARRRQVTRIDTDLAVTEIPLDDGDGEGRASGPLRIAAGPSRTVWVADGRRLLAIAKAGIARRVRLPFAARAITLDAAGTPWVVGTTGRIARISGGRAKTIAARVPGHVGGTIVAGPRDHLWLTVPTSSSLLEVTRSGRATLHPIGLRSGPSDPDRPPRALVADPDGRLWILNRRGAARVNLDDRCRVPQVVGLSARAARATMSAAGCRGVVVGVPASADPDRTFIEKQWVGSGVGRRGTRIELGAGLLTMRAACRFPAGSTEIVATNQAAIRRSSSSHGRVVTWWVCRGAERRVLVLARAEGDVVLEGSPNLGSFALTGERLAYADRNVDHYGGGIIQLHVRDLATPGSERSLLVGRPKPFGSGLPGSYMLLEVAMSSHGVVAWTDQEDEAHVKVLEPGTTVPQVVATAPFGSLSGLWLSDAQVQWRQSGSPHAVGL